MLDETWWMLLTIAGPMLIAAAIAYAMIKQRKLTPADRSQLRDTADQVYMDEEDDGTPIRVDTEKRPPEPSAAGQRRYGEFASTMR